LICQMLEKQGRRVLRLGGGEFDLLAGLLLEKKKYDYYVFEVSSTRLKVSSEFHPHIAVLLNIFFAHGERHHGDFMEYVETKAKIFQNQGANDYLIYDAHAENLNELVRRKEAKAKLVRFSIESRVVPPGVHFERPNIVAEDETGKTSRFPVTQSRANDYPTYIMDLMAAVAVARICGVEDGKIQETIDELKFLPGRLSSVRKLDGVLFIDDSKATNIGATIWALHSFARPILWIVGGELGEGARLARLPSYALGKVKRTLLVGSNTEQLATYLKGLDNLVQVGSLSKAVELANSIAEAGDIVLFSPACPPDRFAPEEGPERGELFKKIVKSLPRTPRINLRKSSFQRI